MHWKKIRNFEAEMKILRILIICLLSLAGTVQALPSVPVWEIVRTSQPSEPIGNDRIDVYVKDGYIYVNTAHPVTVRVLSILGQLISEKDLQPGITRLRITARGVYILKAGDSTIRVSI